MKIKISGRLCVIILLLAIAGCTKTNTAPLPPDLTNTVKDIDGNVYHTVDIGVQTWMVENLKVTHYLNGDPIPYSASDQSAGAYCNYNNDETIAAVYGRLYNYDATTDSRGICPAGWHIPTQNDWSQLEYTLNSPTAAGGAMKEAGTAHWNAPNTGATNSSGFTALPAGDAGGGQFNELGIATFFWSSPTSTQSCALDNTHVQSELLITAQMQTSFISIRCVKNY